MKPRSTSKLPASEQYECSNQAVSSVWNIKIIHALIFSPLEASDRR